MSLRALLILLFSLALFVLLGFVLFIGHIFWLEFSSTILLIPEESVRVHILIKNYGILALSLNILIFLFLYLLLDRIFIKPVKVITKALQDFAEHRTLTPLPFFSRSIKEIKTLAQVFVDFTDNVEQVHVRDMEISRVKSDFISTAAHQLRTPLTGIRWALEALEKGTLTEDQHALVANAVQKSHDLVAVVGTLLDISSIESGKHKYTFTEVGIADLTSEVTADFARLAEENTVTVLYVKGEEFLPTVRADRNQVKWVLNNVIENAIRYTPAGGRVQVTTVNVPGHVQVKVHDTGIGITPKDRENIFERFYRAGNAIAEENAGNGLGLYIARTIATDHGGDLTFESNTDGPGTTFILSLPVFKNLLQPT